MKKLIIFVLIILFILTNSTFAQKTEKQKKEGPKRKTSSSYSNAVTKTYFLKHISPREVQKALRYYFFNASILESKKMITVRIAKENIAQFEQLLKKIDVEKKTITFRIFTVIASQKPNGGKIENKDLKGVIKELKNVLSFKSFKLDGVSLLSLKEGSNHNRVDLSSNFDGLELTLRNVNLVKLPNKTYSIDIGELRLDEFNNRLLETKISIKENGYLVAGVSKIGKNGNSLVLIINAKIK